MTRLKELWHCLTSMRYPNHNRGIEVMRIAAMYGNKSRMESCRFCDGFHVIFREKRGRRETP